MELLRPWVLLLLLPLAALGWRLWRHPAGLGDWPRVADPALLAAMRQIGHAQTGGAGLRLWLLWGAAALLVVALAGPAVPRREAVVYRNLDGVIFVLEASSDTVDGPHWPGLMAGLRTGLQGLGTRPGALIVYGGDAYVAVDMTYDTSELGLTAALIEADTLPDPGRDAGKALQLAETLVRQAELQAGDVVLLAVDAPDPTAGAGLADLPMRVSTMLPAETDAEALRRLAGGHGRGFDLTEGLALAEYLSDSPYRELAENPAPLDHLADLGRWLVALALLPLGALFWGRAR